jgi:serine/threonine protein phosphatase 1
MEREFVVADIHGCYKTFRYLVEEVLQPSRSDRIYLLGDYINKGLPVNSRSIISWTCKIRASGFSR